LKNVLKSWCGSVYAVVEDDRSCAVSVSSSEPVHIQALQSSTRCGSSGQPWQLDAPPGQRVTVSVLDFAPRNHAPPRNAPARGSCRGRRVYGFLVDRTHKTNASICEMTSPAGALSGPDTTLSQDGVLRSGSTDRPAAVTTSSNSPQLLIVTDEHLLNNFLVRVEGQNNS